MFCKNERFQIKIPLQDQKKCQITSHLSSGLKFTRLYYHIFQVEVNIGKVPGTEQNSKVFTKQPRLPTWIGRTLVQITLPPFNFFRRDKLKTILSNSYWHLAMCNPCSMKVAIAQVLSWHERRNVCDCSLHNIQWD